MFKVYIVLCHFQYKGLSCGHITNKYKSCSDSERSSKESDITKKVRLPNRNPSWFINLHKNKLQSSKKHSVCLIKMEQNRT